MSKCQIILIKNDAIGLKNEKIKKELIVDKYFKIFAKDEIKKAKSFEQMLSEILNDIDVRVINIITNFITGLENLENYLN